MVERQRVAVRAEGIPGWWRLAAVAGLVVGVLALPTPQATAARTPPDPADPGLIAHIDAFLQQEMRDADIPGLAVAVVADGQVVHVRGFGVADGAGRPVTEDTPFELASMTKAFTAVLMMQLAEEGKVDLDAPVRRYLPSFDVGTPDQAAWASAITLRNLLQHVGGLDTSVDNPTSTAEGNGDDAIARRLRILAGVPLIAPPGEHYLYGNINYEVLGAVIEAVTGRRFEEVVHDRIYAPLGMQHSHVLAEEAFADGASEGFYRWFGLRTAPFRTPYPRATSPSGVSFSSAADMARWALFQLGHPPGGATLLRPESVAELHAKGPQIDDRHWYGLGWVIRPLWEALDATPAEGPITEPVPDLVEHGGSWETAHTYIGLVPERGWGVVLLTNINDATMSTRYFWTELGLLDLLSGGEPEAPRPFEPVEIRYGKQLVLLLFGLQLTALALTVPVVRGGRPRTVRSRATILAGTAAALVVDLAVLDLLLVQAPAWFKQPIEGIVQYAPDVGALLIPMVVLAGLWGPVRTVLLLRVARRTPASRIAASEDAAGTLTAP